MCLDDQVDRVLPNLLAAHSYKSGSSCPETGRRKLVSLLAAGLIIFVLKRKYKTSQGQGQALVFRTDSVMCSIILMRCVKSSLGQHVILTYKSALIYILQCRSFPPTHRLSSTLLPPSVASSLAPLGRRLGKTTITRKPCLALSSQASCLRLGQAGYRE